MANFTSEAMTAVPSEYFNPGRRVIVYVVPPSVILGSAVASPGMICVPAKPLLCERSQ